MAFNTVHPSGVTMADLILGHLRKVGSISGLEAVGMFKCRSLTRRICDLKAAGHDIRSEWKEDSTGQRYVRYSLALPLSRHQHRPVRFGAHA